MIKSLLILNIQSHLRSVFDFHPGVNVIVGESDAGKSAVIRAFRWLKDNRPQGESIRSWWCKKGDNSVVKIWADDPRHKDDHASREVSPAGEQVYTVGSQVFKAFRTEVPQEVQDYLNMSDINLQLQMDSPFLLSQSPGAVAEYFNKIAKIDKIDISTQNLNSEIRSLTTTIGSEAVKEKPATGLIKLIQDTELSLTGFDHLIKFEADIKTLEESDTRLITLRDSSDKLRVKIDDIDEITSIIEKEEKLLVLEKPLFDLSTLIDDRYQKNLQHEGISRLIIMIKYNQEKIIYESNKLALEKPVSDILKLIKEKKMATDQFLGLFKLVSTISGSKAAFVKAEKNYDAKKELLEQMMPVGSLCPFCGNKIQKYV